MKARYLNLSTFWNDFPSMQIILSGGIFGLLAGTLFYFHLLVDFFALLLTSVLFHFSETV